MLSFIQPLANKNIIKKLWTRFATFISKTNVCLSVNTGMQISLQLKESAYTWLSDRKHGHNKRDQLKQWKELEKSFKKEIQHKVWKRCWFCLVSYVQNLEYCKSYFKLDKYQFQSLVYKNGPGNWHPYHQS